MKNLGIKITIVLIALVSIINAQITNSKQDSIISKNVSSLLYNYSVFGNLTENDVDISQRYIGKFKQLFTENAYLKNDIFSSNDKEMLTVSEYIKGVVKEFPSGLSLEVELLEIRTNNIKRIDKIRMYLIPVNIKKNVFTMDLAGNLIEKDFEQTIEILCDFDFVEFKIDRVTDKQLDLADVAFSFIDVDDSKALKNIQVVLKYDGKVQQEKVTNASGTVMFTKVPVDKRVKIYILENQGFSSEEIPIKTMGQWAEMDDRKIFLKKYKQWKKMGLELFAKPAYTNIGAKPSGDNFSSSNISVTGKTNINGGLNFYYYFMSDDSKAMGIGLGLNLDIYSSNMSITDYTYIGSDTKIDYDGDEYNASVLSNEITDEVQLTYFSIPLVFKYRKVVESKIINYLHVDVGLKYSYLLSGTSMIDGNVEYAGYYPEWDFTIKDVEYLGFIDKTTNYKSDLDINSNLFSFIASVSVSIPIKKPGLFINLGLDGAVGLNNISNYNPDNFIFSQEQGDYTSFVGASKAVRPYSLGGHISIYYDIFK